MNELKSRLTYLDKKDPEFKKTEEVYRKALEENDKETIFKCFHKYCYAHACKMLKGVSHTEEWIYAKSLECTIYAMDRVNRKKYNGKMTYNSLNSWCYYSCMEYLYNKQLRFEESVYYTDNIKQEIEKDDI